MIFNMTGGGSGSGATLVVSCPANVTVTVSKDDKSYTKNSGSLGSATFKGLATGEWTVTIEGNEQTATKNITIKADYAITMAFFAAYINITYPANSTCTVKTSGGTTVASDSNTGSSTKTWTVTVNATGTYTITATSTSDSSKTKSTTVSITAEGQVESVTLSYELIIFEEGTGFANGITVKSKPGFITFDESSINITASMGIGYLNLDPIDVTGYNTIWVDAKTVSNDYGEPVVFGVGETAASAEASKSIAANSSRNTFSLDVSNLTGEKTLFLGTNCGGGTVYNWWLE